MDYTELVEALWHCYEDDDACATCQRWLADDEWGIKCKGRLISDAAAAIEALQAQLPKRGEWINSKERMRPDMCSVCGCVYEADRFMDKIAWNFCPNCGSLMVGENDERN